MSKLISCQTTLIGIYIHSNLRLSTTLFSWENFFPELCIRPWHRMFNPKGETAYTNNSPVLEVLLFVGWMQLELYNICVLLRIRIFTIFYFVYYCCSWPMFLDMISSDTIIFLPRSMLLSFLHLRRIKCTILFTWD